MLDPWRVVDEVVDAVALPQVPKATQVVAAVPKETVAATEGAIEEDIEGEEEEGGRAGGKKYFYAMVRGRDPNIIFVGRCTSKSVSKFNIFRRTRGAVVCEQIGTPFSRASLTRHSRTIRYIYTR